MAVAAAWRFDTLVSHCHILTGFDPGMAYGIYNTLIFFFFGLPKQIVLRLPGLASPSLVVFMAIVCT
jgi:hypothetical protein